MIKPIETHYAGHRFRSRLEARWAVFFDHMGIAWEYEAQGYELGDRLHITGDDTIYYLPDFWLPDFQVHAEVKGSLTDDETRRVLTLAAALSSPTGGCRDNGGKDSVILGPIPEANRRSAYPLRLHLHKGDLLGSPFWADLQYQPLDSCSHHGWGGGCVEVANDCGEVFITGKQLLSGYFDKVGDRWADGYRAARSARFEHGENRGW